MPAGYSNYGKDFMLDALRAEISHMSVHNGDPGDNGANPIAVARQACGFSVAVDGVSPLTAQVTFPVIPGGQTVRWLGLWDALTDGNFIGKIDVTDEAFADDGALNVLVAGTNLRINDPA